MSVFQAHHLLVRFVYLLFLKPSPEARSHIVGDDIPSNQVTWKATLQIIIRELSHRTYTTYKTHLTYPLTLCSTILGFIMLDQ
jgi:hypothetical protein